MSAIVGEKRNKSSEAAAEDDEESNAQNGENDQDLTEISKKLKTNHQLLASTSSTRGFANCPHELLLIIFRYMSIREICQMARSR